MQGIPVIFTCKLQGRIVTQGFPVHITGKKLTVYIYVLIPLAVWEKKKIIKKTILHMNLDRELFS